MSDEFMFFVVTDNNSGEVFSIRYPHDKIMDIEAHVNEWVDMATEGMGFAVLPSEGAAIPYGSHYAELRDTREATGTCWESVNFFIGWDEGF